jgi:hypothetical protein
VKSLKRFILPFGRIVLSNYYTLYGLWKLKPIKGRTNDTKNGFTPLLFVREPKPCSIFYTSLFSRLKTPKKQKFGKKIFLSSMKIETTVSRDLGT